MCAVQDARLNLPSLTHCVSQPFLCPSRLRYTSPLLTHADVVRATVPKMNLDDVFVQKEEIAKVI